MTGTRVAVLLLLSSSGCCVVSAQCGRSDLKMICALSENPKMSEAFAVIQVAEM